MPAFVTDGTTGMDAPSAIASGFAISKIYYALAGLFGGYMLSFFWQPAKLKGHGRLGAGAIIGGISVGSAVIFGGALSIFLGLDPNDANIALAVGGGIGIVAVAIVSLLANFFDKREGSDLLEVVQEIRSVGVKKPTRKPAAKKVAAKKVTKKAAK